jgi:hypothetical protein
VVAKDWERGNYHGWVQDSSQGDGGVLELAVAFVPHWERTKNHQTACFKIVNFVM